MDYICTGRLFIMNDRERVVFKGRQEPTLLFDLLITAPSYVIAVHLLIECNYTTQRSLL